MKSSRFAAATAAIITVLNGCSSVPPSVRMDVNHYFADARDISTVRRIIVLPMQVGDDVEVDEPMIRRALVRELNLLQRFQVEALPSGVDEEVEINLAFTHGHASISALVDLAKRYELDGVVIGRITSYRPYLPPHLGIETRMFSVHTGSWVWIADATFDSNSKICLQDLHHYAATSTAPDETSDEATRMIVLSPGKFASYACHRVVATWREL